MNMHILRPRKLTEAIRSVLRHWTASPARTEEQARDKSTCCNEVVRHRTIRPHWYW
ncbi:MAG: hypothetical protein ACREVO_11790 [Steroidobacteraceae bacterium]